MGGQKMPLRGIVLISKKTVGVADLLFRDAHFVRSSG